MGKGEEFFLISAGDQPPVPSTVRQIFHDAVKHLGRSWKPLLSIVLALLLPYSLLFFGNYLTIKPLIVDMVHRFFMMRTKDPRSPEFLELLAAAMEDLRGITVAEVASMLVSHLLSLLLVVATIYTVAMASRGERVTLKELLSRMRRTWKGPVVTDLYLFLLGHGYTSILFVLVGFVALVSHGSMVALTVGTAATILAILLLVYLQVAWYEGLVVSVVEDEYYGLAALGRASELIRGRRRLGFRVNFHLMLMIVIFFVAYYFVEYSFLPPSENMQLLGQLLMLYCNLVMIVFMMAVYVVFYNECKRSHGEEVAVKERLVYTRVPTAPTIDDIVP